MHPCWIAHGVFCFSFGIITELLWREGYRDAADDAADRILAWQQMWEFRENMHTDPADLLSKSFPYYNWGSAAYCYLSERLYRCD